MKQVFRIETVDGRGMYRSDFGLSVSNLLRDGGENHPLPDQDSLLLPKVEDKLRDMFKERGLDYDDKEKLLVWDIQDIYNDFWRSHFFGFGSIEQLRRWLYKDEWLIKLEEYGLVIAVYEVDDEDAMVGYTQAIFKRTGNDKKTQYNIKQFFNLGV